MGKNLETFSKALMGSESVQSWVGSTKYQVAGEYAEIHDGALVTLTGLAKNDAYNLNGITDVLDNNVFLSKAPEATTDAVVIVDIAGVSQGVIAGNNYKIGSKLVGLRGEAGFPVRYRVPQKHDLFWLSEDCFASTPTVGQYATATASSTKHTPNASNPGDGSYCVKILDKRDFTVGNMSMGYLYLCQVQ